MSEEVKRGDRLANKVALVAGAGSVLPGWGNGKAAAVVYGRQGAKVCCADIRLETAEETAAIIRDEGGEAFAVEADVTKAAPVAAMVEACRAAFGRIDILHNNVGGNGPGRGLTTVTEDDWHSTFDLNVTSAFLTCKAVIPFMEDQGGGAIVNISSINAIRTLPALSGVYGASKAGMIALTREMAVEYASKGIRANAVLPGMMNTPFVEHALTEAWGGDMAEMMRMRDAMIPTGKQGESWDVAQASLFLASDDAKFITGATLVVDGALTSTIKTN